VGVCKLRKLLEFLVFQFISGGHIGDDVEPISLALEAQSRAVTEPACDLKHLIGRDSGQIGERLGVIDQARYIGWSIMHSLFKMFSQAVRALVLLVAAIVMMNGSALAHELSPAVADLSFEEDRFELRFEMNVEAVMAEIGPDHDDTDDSPNAAEYDALRALSADELKERFSAFSESFLGGLDVRTDDCAPKPMWQRRAMPLSSLVERPPKRLLSKGRRPVGFGRSLLIMSGSGLNISSRLGLIIFCL